MKKTFAEQYDELIKHQLYNNSVSESFPEKLENLTREQIKERKCKNRIDLTALNVLTIDCDTTNDMDDGISFSKTEKGILLGVHIADVSAYVNGDYEIGTELENEAIKRGTSIYLPGRTLPMLPPVLSDDICSLNPNENRNTLSVLINMDEKGNVYDYKICKAVIRSRVKGIYSEVNHILDKTATTEEKEKYKSVYEDLIQMRKLANNLRNTRKANGATISKKAEAEFIVNSNNVEIRKKNQGTAGVLVEEFMILANRLVSEYFTDNNLPGIYRIQKETGKQAEYSSCKNHHAELALENYFHYTSPIRRLADLIVHTILSDHLEGVDTSTLHINYDKALKEICEYATHRSRRANNIELICKKACEMKFFANKTKTRFFGEVVGYNRKKRPIIRLNKYNISVLGAINSFCKIGERYGLYVCIGSNALYASNLSKVKA